MKTTKGREMKAAILGAATLLVAFAVPASAKVSTNDGMIEKYAASIRHIESTNRYGVTANAGNGRTALGAYQVLNTNLPKWSREAVGREVSQSEFLRSKELQDRIFRHRFSKYVAQYGADGAAKAWLGGPGAAKGKSRGADRFGSTPDSYAAKFRHHLTRHKSH
jgi:hypothetical protein